MTLEDSWNKLNHHTVISKQSFLEFGTSLFCDRCSGPARGWPNAWFVWYFGYMWVPFSTNADRLWPHADRSRLAFTMFSKSFPPTHKHANPQVWAAGARSIANPPTHRVRACRAFPFLQTYNLSFLPFFRFFLSSKPPAPQGAGLPQPLTPLLPTNSLHLFVAIPIRSLLFRSKISHGWKSKSQNEPEWVPKSITKWSENKHGE